MRTIFAASAVGLLLVGAQQAQGQFTVTPAAGYTISDPLSEGAFFSNSNPAPVPDNLALATNGSTPIAAPGPYAQHPITGLNDGSYGNSYSYIGSETARTSAIIDLPGSNLHNLTSFAFGRDNGIDGANGDACGGQCADRSLGLYEIYFTQVAAPDLSTAVTGDPTTGFASIGTINYTGNQDGAIGLAGFTSYYRHDYNIAEAGGDPIQATGFRIDLPATNAIDEIELYGTPVPEPTSLALLGLGGLGLLRRRQR